MSNITTTERIAMLADTLAATIADAEGIHPAHARNRVDLAMQVVSGIGTAVSNSSGSLRPLTAKDVIDCAYGADGQRLSDETRRLVTVMWQALGGEIVA